MTDDTEAARILAGLRAHMTPDHLEAIDTAEGLRPGHSPDTPSFGDRDIAHIIAAALDQRRRGVRS